MKNNKKVIIIIGIIVLLMIGVIIAVNMKREEQSDDYIAVFHGGVGEVTYQTYIYKNGDGFKYVNETCNTIRYGSPEWKCKITAKGKFDFSDESFSIAKKNGAYSYVTIPNDENSYTIEEFKTTFTN